MTATVEPVKFKGYWPEALMPILDGTVAEPESENLRIYANVLLKHRLNGNPLASEQLAVQEYQEVMLQNFFQDYQAIKEKKELADRSALVETVFMKAIAEKSFQPVLDQDDKNYIEAVSLPTALAAVQRTNYLQDEKIKAWLLSYREACIKKEEIQYNVESYRGLSVREIQILSKARSAVVNLWYPEYKKPDGSITNDGLKSLLDVLKNPFLRNAILGYADVAADFPEENRDAYWKSTVSNLGTFLQKAVSEDPLSGFDFKELKEIADDIISDPYVRSLIPKSIYRPVVKEGIDYMTTVVPKDGEDPNYEAKIPQIIKSILAQVEKKLNKKISPEELVEEIYLHRDEFFDYTI